MQQGALSRKPSTSTLVSAFCPVPVATTVRYGRYIDSDAYHTFSGTLSSSSELRHTPHISSGQGLVSRNESGRRDHCSIALGDCVAHRAYPHPSEAGGPVQTLSKPRIFVREQPGSVALRRRYATPRVRCTTVLDLCRRDADRRPRAAEVRTDGCIPLVKLHRLRRNLESIERRMRGSF